MLKKIDEDYFKQEKIHKLMYEHLLHPSTYNNYTKHALCTYNYSLKISTINRVYALEETKQRPAFKSVISLRKKQIHTEFLSV